MKRAATRTLMMFCKIPTTTNTQTRLWAWRYFCIITYTPIGWRGRGRERDGERERGGGGGRGRETETERDQCALIGNLAIDSLPVMPMWIFARTVPSTYSTIRSRSTQCKLVHVHAWENLSKWDSTWYLFIVFQALQCSKYLCSTTCHNCDWHTIMDTIKP